MNEGGKETCRLYFICRNFYVTKCGSWEGEVLKDFFGRDKGEELKTVN
ncbi:hypothetical protein [uncultured Peptoniphilus sp.]|nr:hypothetical protein [uncultured Peptoniphilus sp.]MDU6783575.1 hypothetical protein [Peptoniphilus harei]